MKVTNFRLKKVIGSGPSTWRLYASVDVQIGVLFKRVVTVDLFRSYMGPWRLMDGGEIDHSCVVSDLEKAYEARHECEITSCPVVEDSE